MKKTLLLLVLTILLVGCGEITNKNGYSENDSIQENIVLSGKTYYLIESSVYNQLNKSNSNQLIFSDMTFKYIGNHQQIDFLGDEDTYSYKTVGNDLYLMFVEPEKGFSYLGEFSFNGELLKTYDWHVLFATEAYLTEQLGITVI